MPQDNEITVRGHFRTAVLSAVVASMVQFIVWLWWGASFVATTNIRIEELKGVPERLVRIEEAQKHILRLLEDSKPRTANRGGSNGP